MLLGCVLGPIVSEAEDTYFPVERARDVGLANSPAMATLHEVCAKLMMLIGPMMWAALIVLFVEAEFFAR